MGTGSETLRRVIAVAERDESAAWLIVEAAALRAALRARRRFRLDHAACEDLAHDAALVAVKDGFAALRRRDPDTPLAAWLTICVENLARARRRREHRAETASLEDDDAVAQDADGELSPSLSDATADVAELLGELTPTQRSVEEARLAAGSERHAAKRLGLSRNRIHDIHRRALKRLRKGAPPVRDESPWATPAAAHARRVGDEDLARLLDLLAAGRTRREIAEALGTTVTAVRGRVSRARRRWREIADS